MVRPSSIPNCIVDLDASDMSTITTNENGQVTNWRSRTDNGVSFTRSDIVYERPDFHYTNDFTQTGLLPYYRKDGIGGLPAVNFGIMPDNTMTVSVLQADCLLPTNRTFFVVSVMPDSQRVNNAFLYGYSIYDTECALLRHAFDKRLDAWLPRVFTKDEDSVCWSNGELAFDLEKGVYHQAYDYNKDKYVIPFVPGKPHLFVLRRTSVVANYDKSATTSRPTLGLSSVHYYSQWQNWIGSIGEFVVYERDLTDAEIEQLSFSLMEKWGIINCWKGGDSGNWSDPDNWSGAVPTADADVYVMASAAITIDTNASIAKFHAPAGVSLTVTEGKTFAVADSMDIPEQGFSFAAQGATLSFPQDANLNQCSAFVLSGSNTLQVAAGRRFELPPVAQVSGALALSDLGTFVCTADGQFNSVRFSFGAGILDLNGTRQTFAGGLTGGGILTNSAVAQATAVLTTATAADRVSLDRVVAAGVRIEVPGPGTVDAVAFRDHDFLLSGGTLYACKVRPADIAGCVADLDASDPDSIELTEDGLQVERWRSRTSNGLAFEHSTLNYTAHHSDFPGSDRDFRLPTFLPWYGADLLGGTRAGVRFGTNPAGAFQESALECNQFMPSNVTMFLVVQLPSVQKNDSAEIYGPPTWGDQGYSFFKLVYSKSACQWDTRFVSDAAGWINGELRYDSAAGVTPNLVYEASKPHLICFRRNGLDKTKGLDKPLQTIKPMLGVGSMHIYSGLKFIQCVIGELVVYDRRLSDVEVGLMMQLLMDKWGIEPAQTYAIKDTLGTNSTVTVAALSTYDMSQAPQHPKTLEFVKNAQGVAPTLTVRSAFDLSQTELALSGGVKTRAATLIDNPDQGLSETFKNAGTADIGSAKLRVSDSKVWLSAGGTIIIIR